MEQLYLIILPAVFIIMSVGGFLSMWSDKKRAEAGERRIPEAVLFLIAFLLGGLGSMLGMFICHHKTKHWCFLVFMPILAVWSVAVTVIGELLILFTLITLGIVKAIANSVNDGTAAIIAALLSR